MDLDKEFQVWWLQTGEQIASDIVTSIYLQDPKEAVRLLCRITYCQGRIDEQTNIEQQLQQRRG